MFVLRKPFRRLSAAIFAAAIAASSFTAVPPMAAAFDAPAPDTGAAGGISGGGEWSIYNSKVGYTRSSAQGNTITDRTNGGAGTAEVTGSATIGAAFQFDLSTMNSNAAAGSDKVIKSAKLRLTPMVSKSGTNQVVYAIDDAFNTTEGKTPIAEFAVPRGTGDDFFSDSDITALTAEDMSEYPAALANWQTAVDVTGNVITSGNVISLLVEYSSGNANKTEYATSDIAQNARLNGGKVPLLYNSGLTDYSKWIYPQIVFEYTDKDNYKNALADFIKAEEELSAGTVTETRDIIVSGAENGSTITLEMYGDAVQPIKVDGSSLVLSDEYAGNDACAYVNLIVTNTADGDTASYSKVIAVPAEYTRSNIISFDTAKNPKGEISVTSGGKTYTDGTAYAKSGGSFTVNDGANTGYRARVTVTDADGNTVSKNSDGTYTMPSSNVSVSISYEKKTYGMSRVAATNSASVRANGDVNGDNVTIAAGRMAFLKFDLSGYSERLISSAQLSFSADNTGNRVSTAIFYVPNNNWTESGGLGANFCIKDGDENTRLDNFNSVNLFDYTTTYKDVAPDVPEEMLDKANGEADLSSAANGVLKDYFLGAYGASFSLDVTSAIKDALERNSGDREDGTITLMLYSPRKTGLDIKSVTSASSLYYRPSLTITETASALSDDELITEISTAEELEQFAAIVSGGNDYAGKTVTLQNDIDLSEKYNADGESWTPIGTYDGDMGTASVFAGAFDGGGHTVSGLYINDRGIAQGLFGAVSGSVKDLTVSGEINGSSVIGGIAGWCGGSVSNCTVSVNITAEREAGGIAGTLSNGGTISDCVSSGSIEIKDKESYAGGIAAHNIGGVIRNCRNTGSVKNGSDAFRNRIGGIVGYLDAGEIYGCQNSGEISSAAVTSTYVADETQNYVGGIIGYSQSGSASDCANSGTVYNAVDYAGGIAGYLHSRDTVSKCRNDGNVSGKSYVGGIAGSSDSAILNCQNTGSVSGTGKYIGGAVGYLSSGTVQSCLSLGAISGGSDAGGTVGFAASGAAVNCYYLAGTAGCGINGVDLKGSAEGQTADEFASGEAAYYMQGEQPEQVWGQQVIGDNTDTYPIYTADSEKRVYKVTFGVEDEENAGQYKEYAARYTNAGGTVELPEQAVFEHWSTVAGDASDSRKFTADTVINGDITVYAIGGQSAPKPYEIVSCTVEDKGDTAAVKDVTVRAENADGLKLYTAVYDGVGVLKSVTACDVTKTGESVVHVGAEADKADTVKTFLWRGMEPLTAVKSISLTEE